MNEENQINLAVAILEQEIDKTKILRNKTLNDGDIHHFNNKIMGYVDSITTLRSWINPDLDD